METLGNFLAVCGPSPGLLSCYTEGRPLTHHLLSSSVQSILHLLGLSGSYSRHSFRIGAARTAASRGLPDHLIKTLGWWFSDAYQCYFRTSAGSLNWRGMYSMVFAAFFATGVGCLRSAPLEAVAYWPQAPITPGWVNPEVLWQGGWGSWLGCR